VPAKFVFQAQKFVFQAQKFVFQAQKFVFQAQTFEEFQFPVSLEARSIRSTVWCAKKRKKQNKTVQYDPSYPYTVWKYCVTVDAEMYSKRVIFVQKKKNV
jgi:hypothetical protein